MTAEDIKGGRPKGAVNKLNAKARDNIANVFTMMGGAAKMLEWANKNQTEFYKLYARLIPQEVKATGFIAPEKKTAQDTDKEFARKVAFVLAKGVHDMDMEALFNSTSTTKPN